MFQVAVGFQIVAGVDEIGAGFRDAAAIFKQRRRNACRSFKQLCVGMRARGIEDRDAGGMLPGA